MLILREVAASIEDSSSALSANGGTGREAKRAVVNPEAVQRAIARLAVIGRLVFADERWRLLRRE
jgi:hypothetical protein